jgi:hypothetical protein
MTLTLHGAEVANVFRLVRLDENSASSALGWTLSQSPKLRDLAVAKIFGAQLDAADAAITLQHSGGDGGFTDVEIQSGRTFHAIIEAKRNWDLPTVAQLKRYAPRLAANKAARQRLVTVSAADAGFAARRLPPRIGGVALTHLSWGDLAAFSAAALGAARKADERFWLRQWTEHLQEFVAMERRIDNLVFVVSLSRIPLVEDTHSGIDVVEKDRCYYHPVGDGWPVQPPNYVGFRYRGALQSVHHIDSFEVVEDLSKRNRHWHKTDRDYFVYRLGPPMRPAKPIRTGALYSSLRVKCAIDTLLSGAFATIAEARVETQRRRDEVA